jgi:hypothetical protein
MSEDKLDVLNDKVGEAIRSAERIADQTGGEAKAAHLKVSVLEEQIAELTAPETMEGAIARRGAVRAALKAGDEERAVGLVAKYTTAGINDTLSEELQALLVRK